VTNNFTNSSGTFTSGSNNLSIGGTLSNSAGAAFVAPVTGKTFSVGSNFSNAGTFSHNSGTITLNGQGVQSVTSGGSALNNVIDSNVAAAVSQADTSTIAGTLTINNSAIYDINGQNITLATLSNNGTFKLQGGETTATITNMDSDSGKVIYNGAVTYSSLKLGNSYFDLEFAGSGTYTLGATLSVANNLKVTSGTLDGSTRTINVGGDWDSQSGTFVYSTSSVVLSGDGTLKTSSTDYWTDFYDLSMAANGKTTQMLTVVGVSHNLILGTGSLTKGSSPDTYWLFLTKNDGTSALTNAGASITLDRIYFTITSGSTVIPSGNYGNITYLEIYARGSNTTFDITGDVTVGGRIFYLGMTTLNNIVLNSNDHQIDALGMTYGYSSVAGTTTTNFGSSTINIGTAGFGRNASGGSHTINLNSANINVTGNFNLTGLTVVKGTSNLNLIGSAGQTLTSASNQLHNFSTTNASSSGITLADDLSLDGTFTDTTASSKITFNSGSTYAFNAININGQAEGTRVVLTSSTGGSPWNLNITASSPTASNVSVKDSNANKDIDATTGGYDASGNTHWLFPQGNSAPVNDSLTFTNPYSSNIAVADNATEWNFRALVTDGDGPTNLNYVELRLANSTDSTQPYDSLKFRWTEATDAFSEEADTQSAAAITSTSANSNASGNQWTLDFKIKFNSSFATTSTNYAAELYAVDDAAASDTDNYSNTYQVQNLSLTFSVDSNSLNFGSLLPGSVITGTTQTTVTTNYPNGYALAASDNVAGSDSCLLSGSTRIADYAGTITTPTSWTGTGLGISLYSATGKNTAQWGSGSTESDSANKYAGVPQNATTIHSKSGSPTLSDISKIGYKLVVPNSQKTGSYSGDITYTVTGALN